MNSFFVRSAAALVAALSLHAAVAQTSPTPITVQVINDSGVSDSAVYLLLSGSDVNVVPATGPAYNYPFSVSGVSATPAGTVSFTAGNIPLAQGTLYGGTAPLTVTSGATTMGMSFSPATIGIAGTSTLTITLPNAAGAPMALLQPFSLTMPDGLVINPPTDTGTCTTGSAPVGVNVSASGVSIAAGASLPVNGCTIVVGVLGTSATAGTLAVTASYLQTAPANVAPATAPLAVTNVGQMAVTFSPSTIAVGQPSVLTISIPNANNDQLPATGGFSSTLPAGVVTSSGNTGSCTGVTVTPATISMPNPVVPPGGCTIVVSVTSGATGGALSALASAGSVTSPYTNQSRTVYQFTMSTVSSGNLFLSYNTGVAYPPAPTVTATYRFQPLEFSYSNAIVSNGDLTSIDFYGIPLELQTFAPSDTALQFPLDRVTYYTSTPTLLQSFLDVNPSLVNAMVASGASGNTTFVPGTPFPNNFLRMIGPNQVAAPGASPLPSNPQSKPKPWPYPSFGEYLHALASSGYTFREQDANVISAYTFNYTGTITKMTAQTTASCMPANMAADGWLIHLTGTTQAASPLPSNADICIPLQLVDGGHGSGDFFIYGAVQNCESLGLSSSGTLYPCSDSDAATIGQITNSVYGWIQADVLSALNFGYMQGVADAQTAGVGYSNVWYNLPPVQYPFGQARSANDGRYNPWAAMMYNHSDAYGFAFSDRKGRPSPDISFPIGGTLRIWILPDTRLDAPLAAVTAVDSQSITLSWPTVANADHYVVAWSPPYATNTDQVPQPPAGQQTVSYQVKNLQPGTPYTVTLVAANADGTQRSTEMPVYATTQGATPTTTAGSANVVFGVNWVVPSYPQLPTPTPVTLATTSSTLNVVAASTASYVTQSVVPSTMASTGSAQLTITLGNGGQSALTLSSAFAESMPNGMTITSTSNAGTCQGVALTATQLTMPSASTIPAGGCTIIVNLGATVAGATTLTTGSLVTGAGTVGAVSTPLIVTGAPYYVQQAFVPATVAPSAATQLTLTFVTPTALMLTSPYTYTLPVGVTVGTPVANIGTCPGVTVKGSEISMPAQMAFPEGGCTIIVNVASATAGAYTGTTPVGATIPVYAPDLYVAGRKFLYNGMSAYNPPVGFAPTTSLTQTSSFPMQLALNGQPIWGANYYLTFQGSTSSYTVPADSLTTPNFLERQLTPLTVTGASVTPPYSNTYPPTMGVSFTPVANKLAAPVAYPPSAKAPSTNLCPFLPPGQVCPI